TSADARPGAPPVAMITQSFWRQRLGGASGALGKTIRLDSVDVTVVGILPETMGPLERGQEYFVAGQWDTPRRKGPFFLIAIGRLPDSSSLGVAEAELRAINKRIFPVWQSSYQDAKATWGAMDLKRY